MEKLLTVQEIAAAWSVSTSKVYGMFTQGHLEGFYIGRSLRLTESSVNAYLRRVRITPLEGHAASTD